MNEEKSYNEIIIKYRVYNPKYGDSRNCKCGHIYERHFDFYEEEIHRQPVGCKYCHCHKFEEE